MTVEGITNQDEDVLLIHPGGLGDVCVSESTLLSLRLFFGHRITVVGTKRVLNLFSEYFVRVQSIDSRKWSYLFSETAQAPRWPTIVLIGKDRDGSLRRRLAAIAGQVLFISMYPDRGLVHAEDHQLRQLATYGIKPYRKDVQLVHGDRIILYPEAPQEKVKWPAHLFVSLYERLKEQGLPAVLLRQANLSIPVWDLQMPESLADAAELFSAGGLFVSNDSGMAHFAARCGLLTCTIFNDADPTVWRPRNGITLAMDGESPSVDRVAETIVSLRNYPR